VPQVGVQTEGLGQGPSVFDKPKLEPAFKDERARIFIPNPGDANAPGDTWMEWRHSIGGQRAARGLPPGSPVPGWGGNWICTGRDEVLKASNPMLDPEACVMCRAHRDGDPVVDKPVRKYVQQIFRYNTDASGFQLQMPFGVRFLVWICNDKEFGQIRTLAQTWQDLRKYDLLLSATSKEFKTWDVSIQPQALWATQQEWINVVQQTYAAQHTPVAELELLIGRRATNDNEILAKVQEVKAVAQNVPPQGYYPPPQGGWPQQMPGPQQQPPSYFPGAAPMAPAAAAPVPDLAAPPSLGGAPIPPAPTPDYSQPQPQLQPPAMAPPAPAAAPLAPPPPMMAPPPQQPMAPPPPQMAPPPAAAAPVYDPAQMPPLAAPQQVPPPPNGAAPQPVDFRGMIGVPAAPPPPPAA
jgi:hypothetical protein